MKCAIMGDQQNPVAMADTPNGKSFVDNNDSQTGTTSMGSSHLDGETPSAEGTHPSHHEMIQSLTTPMVPKTSNTAPEIHIVDSAEIGTPVKTAESDIIPAVDVGIVIPKQGPSSDIFIHSRF